MTAVERITSCNHAQQYMLDMVCFREYPETLGRLLDTAKDDPFIDQRDFSAVAECYSMLTCNK